MGWHQEDEWNEQWEEVKKMEKRLKKELTKVYGKLRICRRYQSWQRISVCLNAKRWKDQKKKRMVHRGNEE